MIVGRLIPLGHLQPPRLVAHIGPPTLRGILTALTEPVEQLEALAEQQGEALLRNEGTRCADHLDVFTQDSTRETLLKEFALTQTLIAHLRGVIETGSEVLGW
jgi:hypothetical protein